MDYLNRSLESVVREARVFSLLDRASVPRGKGAIICMKQDLSAIDKDKYIIPMWLI